MTIVSSPLQKKIQSNFELISKNTDDLREHRQMVITHNTKKCRSGAGMARCPSGYKYNANGKCRWFLKNRKK